MYPTKWEYLTESCPEARKKSVTVWLDDWGNRGWELVTVMPASNAFIYFFKRPIDYSDYIH